LIATKNGYLEYTSARSAGSWYVTVVKTLLQMHSHTTLVKELGLTPWQPAVPTGDAEWLREEEDILKAAWKLCLELASARLAVGR
jgi:hypothetical protein